MKKFITLVLILFVFFGACDNNLFTPEFTKDFNNSGVGNVRISIGTENGRTILPSRYDLSVLYYKLIFTDADSDEVVKKEYLDGGTTDSFDMDPGDYKLTVYGFINAEAAENDNDDEGTGALFSGSTTEKFTVTSSADIEVAVVLKPNSNILTRSSRGKLEYEITIPEGASGTLTIGDGDPIDLDEEENEGEVTLSSEDYVLIVVVEYEEKVKVKREIVQIYDNATSKLTWLLTDEDFKDSKSVAITNVVFAGNDIEVEGIETQDITVWVHPELIPSLNEIAPKITFTGAMIKPTGKQDFSIENNDNGKTIEYTVYNINGEPEVFNITVKIATVNFNAGSEPSLTVTAAIESANYGIADSNPAADTLTLYYAQIDEEDNEFPTWSDILNAENKLSISIDNNNINGVISSLIDDKRYCFVVEAELEYYNNSYSSVVSIIPSSKNILTKEDFDWSGDSVSYTGEPLSVTINATSVNGADSEITDITVLYTGKSPTEYDTSETPPANVGTYEISVRVAATASFAAVSNLPLDGDYIINPIEFTSPPVLNALELGGFNSGKLSYSFEAAYPSSGTTYKVYYAEGNDFENAQALIDADGTDSVISTGSGDITGLKNNTPYSFVVEAINNNRITAYSNIVNETTNEGWVTRVGTPTRTQTAYYDSLTYSFAPTVPPADTYTIWYRSGTTNYTATTIKEGDAKSIIIETDSTETITGTITGLTSGTNYKIMVFAEKGGDVHNSSVSSGNTSTRTLAVAVTQNADLYSQLNYTISYPSVDPEVSYRIYYLASTNATAATIRSTGATKDVTKDELTGLITGLAPSTQYRVVMDAVIPGTDPEPDIVVASADTVRSATTRNYFNAWGAAAELAVSAPIDFNILDALVVTFKATTPPSTEYTVHYRQGDYSTAANVRSGNTSVTFEVDDLEQEEFTFTIPDLEPGYVLYSVVVDGKATIQEVANTITSNVAQGRTHKTPYDIVLSQTGTYTFNPPVIAGYTVTPLAQEFTIENTGTQATGTLTIAVSESDKFELSAVTVASIDFEGTGTFTVKPKTGLAEGTHTATVTVSGDNNLEASFGVSFSVYAEAATLYRFSAPIDSRIESTHTVEVGLGSTQQIPVTVSRISGSSGALTAALTGEDADKFTLSATSFSQLSALATSRSFNIIPNEGITAGTYNATVTVYSASNTAVTFDLIYTVVVDFISLWKTYSTVTETFTEFMKGDLPSGSNLIADAMVTSEEEVSLKETISGEYQFTFAECQTFDPTGVPLWSFAWPSMRDSYAIEQWKELQGRTNNVINNYITQDDLIWVEVAGVMGQGAQQDWGLNPDTAYPVGESATLQVRSINSPPSFNIVITMNFDTLDPRYFTLVEDGNLEVDFSSHPIISAFLTTSRWVASDIFTLDVEE